jgi:hypothetical protein
MDRQTNRAPSIRIPFASSAASGHPHPERHPIAIALRRQDDVDDARVTKNETLIRRGKQWFRYDAPDKRLFKQLQKTLPA